jgi:hypothetical protein
VKTEAVCPDFDAMMANLLPTDPICVYYSEEATDPSTAVFLDDCTLPFLYDLFDPRRVYLYVDCVPIPQDSAGGTVNWILLSPAAPNLESRAVMVGPLCEQVSTIGVRRIDFAVGCEVFPVI